MHASLWDFFTARFYVHQQLACVPATQAVQACVFYKIAFQVLAGAVEFVMPMFGLENFSEAESAQLQVLQE